MEEHTRTYQYSTTAIFIGNQSLIIRCLQHYSQVCAKASILQPHQIELLRRFSHGAFNGHKGITTINALFEKQVLLDPDSDAVINGGTILIFAELRQKSNQVAHAIAAAGFKSNACIGVLLDRSELLIVALLGILKSGCHYLPLDPQYPADRLRYLVGDSNAAAVLTIESIYDAFSQKS